MNFNGDEIKSFKALIGRFLTEMKNNSVTDLVIWLDCLKNYEQEQHEEFRKVYEENKKRRRG